MVGMEGRKGGDQAWRKDQGVPRRTCIPVDPLPSSPFHAGSMDGSEANSMRVDHEMHEALGERGRSMVL